MKIIMESGHSSSELTQREYDFAFFGEAIDERSTASIAYVCSKASTHVNVKYLVSELKILLNDTTIEADDIGDYIHSMNISRDTFVIIDCTSIGVVELLLIIQSLYECGCLCFDSLYVEPKQYKRRSEEFMERRMFQLSTKSNGFVAIPGHTMAFENTDKAVFLCGFEGERVGRAFEDLPMQGQNCQLIFGMPAYVIGWDMHSYINHLSCIESNNISKEFYYCAAANPLSVYEKLNQIYSGIDEEQKLFIIPFGSRPMALGACIFKVCHKSNNLSILYDHPIRINNLSQKVAKWNLYRVKL